MNLTVAFLRIVDRFTDRRWGEVRDDLISKSIKVLRKYAEGKSPKDLKESKLTEGLGDFYEELYEIYKENPEGVERLAGALSAFIKSPVPCKLKMIDVLKLLLEE